MHLELAIDERIHSYMRGIVDFDFLVMSVHRLLQVAERAKRLGCDAIGELALAIRIFNSKWKDQLGDVRNALEHIDHADALILPIQNEGTIRIVWRGGEIDVHQLYVAADKLITAVCATIARLES